MQPMYCGVFATNMTGSSSDDWIYYQVVTHSLLITLIHRRLFYRKIILHVNRIIY
jgi:hypothetical protein